MEDLDEKSKAFIERTLKKLEDNQEFLLLVGRVMSQTFDFYMDTPREMLIKLCKEKMIAGAKEHGEPLTDPIKVLREIRMEDLDKLVWNCMLDEANSED